MITSGPGRATPRRALRSPSFAWPLLRATPLVLVGLIAWSWGEGVAYASKAFRGLTS